MTWIASRYNRDQAIWLTVPSLIALTQDRQHAVAFFFTLLIDERRRAESARNALHLIAATAHHRQAIKLRKLSQRVTASRDPHDTCRDPRVRMLRASAICVTLNFVHRQDHRPGSNHAAAMHRPEHAAAHQAQDNHRRVSGSDLL